MLRKWAPGVLTLLLALVLLPARASAAPQYWCQNAGDSWVTAGYSWYRGYESAISAEYANICSAGCAIVSAAMALYPNVTVTAYYDKRYAANMTSAADPYSVYVTNGNSVYANWDAIATAFGGKLVGNIGCGSQTDDWKASYIRQQLASGYYPIVHIPGHYVLICSYQPAPGSVSVSDELSTSDWQTVTVSSAPDVVRPEDINQITDTGLRHNRYVANGGAVSPTGIPIGYDNDFKIHDPYWTNDGRGGYYIPFYKNIKGASFSSIDQIVTISRQ